MKSKNKISEFRFVLAVALCTVMVQTVLAEVNVPLKSADRITVGVRSDARPFSYMTPTRTEEDLLPGYGGYMIEICRRVLSEMITSGPFTGYSVDLKVVSAESRLPALDSGQVDMLCGPDSITLNRLYKYNTSHPLFLSGITYVTVMDELFPRRKYCGAVIGLVAGTTAETEGLREIADNDSLQLYDAALEKFLSLYGNAENIGETIDVIERIESIKKNLAEGFISASESVQGHTKVAPKLVVTEACPNGHESGPVVFYDNHQSGINDLCEGKILFYVADVDILRERIGSCKVIMQRETLTREAYGVYFRRQETPLMARPGGSVSVSTQDSVLYAEFNNVLLRKMQKAENILDYEFNNEFKGESPTEDLQRFFDGYKFVVDY